VYYNLRMSVGRLPIVSSVDALADELRQLILNGDLEPGARLRELYWSQRYGVGRQTFRAAAQQLAFHGLLLKRTNHGYSIPELDAESIDDVYRMRRVLTVEALRGVMEAGDVPTIAVEAVAELKSFGTGGSWSEVADACARFHRALIDGARSPRLARAYDAVWSEVLLCIALAAGQYEYPAANAAAEHGEILRHIQAGDTAAAESALTELFEASATNVKRAREERRSNSRAAERL
jgi:DNA-binding GntR family transcriptional regulator